MTADREVQVTWRDASGLAASVASVRPEIVARLADATPAVADEAAIPACTRTPKPCG